MKEKLSILLIDDNAHFTKRMVSILNEEVDDISFIHTANHAEEALGLLDKQPDLVFLDINMPGKNGLDLLKRIKSTTKNCEVVMLSNHSEQYYREQCRKLGAFHFLDKTIEFEQVPSVIKNFAARNGHKLTGNRLGKMTVSS
jgi:YesN/AraC family two-component response regulator